MRTAAPTRPAPAFVTGLRRHGARTALIGDGERLTYAELADRVDDAAAALAGPRRVVLLAASSTVSSLVAYLAALRGGHVVLLAPAGDPGTLEALRDAWRPDLVVGPDGNVTRNPSGAHHELHDDLALLMATSGSTGSPRLVRLARASLEANAAAIADYLDIRPTDRAVTTLPLHYCYGLSVVHANLLTGAALVLTDASVTEPGFWEQVREHGVTSLHGVPHSFALLERAGFAAMDLPHLRYVTQAGGRLTPDQVRFWAATGERRGWRFVVMYGQTEATARMAYLPPGLAASAPEAIGRAIPGGELRIDAPDVDGVGEIVYRGPNVMLGYAHTPADLALGRAVTELRTGDLGRRRPDGLFEVTGRRSRFVKPFGVRVDLDAVETLLGAQGLTAAVTGDDTGLVVAVEHHDAAAGSLAEATTEHDLAARARELLTARLHLPGSAVAVVVVAELPRRANGKLDHPAVATLAPVDVPRRRGTVARLCERVASGKLPATVHEIFARTFPGQELDDAASFVDLGGDSLTYVAVSADLERALGELPRDWDTVPLGELAARAAPTTRPSRWARLESVVVLRALAIVLVVGEHDHLWTWLGGAHLLLAIAGWTFSRFLLTRADDGDPALGVSARLPQRILRSAALIAVPSSLWILLRSTMTGSVQHQDALLLGSVFHPLVQGYWFVDSLVQILVMMALLFSVPAVRRFERRHRFGLPATVLAASLTLWWVPSYDRTVVSDLYSTHLVLWLFVLGWMLHRATTPAQRAVTVAAALVLVPAFFGSELERAAIVLVGLGVLLFAARIRVPRVLAAPLTAIASASLGIYLTHFALLPLADVGVPPVALVALGLVVGIAAWRLGNAAVHRAVLLRAPRRPRVPAAAPATR
ncbi:AMP-binding protein [Actinomycetospora endophytica]|uniref:AMP-binding protein n=1 Tax=Actinomycetospora endophytica TaxID=2291215 RepID=A0ABS8PC01_9PSEU|nr:AMP-binding protein [Actinomycetospora endophytica]MCD2195781.1 AMP-binding protein [Actinomycetospora endophytica]